MFKKIFRIILVLLILMLSVSCMEKDIDNARYLKDYEYLWHSLENSYPYFGVVERSNIDWRKIKEEYKDKLLTTSLDDIGFYSLLDDMLKQFRSIGHLSIISEDFYHKVRYIYSDAHFLKWEEIFESPNSERFYNYDGSNYNNNTYIEDNIEYTMNEEDSIAYVNFKSFWYFNLEEDQVLLFDFYKKIEEYNHLIIDLRENGGGSAMYYTQNIIEPLINDVIDYKAYMLFSGNSYNTPFILSLNENSSDFNQMEGSQFSFEILDISELPEFTSINEEDIKGLDKILLEKIRFKPDGNLNFKGRIWVLIGESVYSAADSFAQVCKSTGFATLVGNTTEGDGIGIDPIVVSLPETGIMFRFSTHYGLNENGENNEEFGTPPDILIDFGLSYYDKLLEIIKEGN